METAKLRKTWNIVSRNSLIWNSPPGLEIQAPFLCQKWDISFFQVLFQTTKFLTVCDYGEQGFLSTSEIRKWGHPKNGVIMTPFSCIMSFREIWKEVLVAQSCLTPCNPMDCSPPGSSVHEIPGKNTRVGWHSLLQGTFPTQGSNLSLLHCRQILYCLSHQGSPWEKYGFPLTSQLALALSSQPVLRIIGLIFYFLTLTDPLFHIHYIPHICGPNMLDFDPVGHDTC